MPPIATLSVYLLVLKQVRRDIRDSRNGGHCQDCLLTVKCVKYVWLSYPTWPSRWVLCISMLWLRLKSCHVACDEWTSGEICSLQHMWVIGSVMWAAASDKSLKFGVQGATATNWFSRVNGARDNGIWLYIYIIIDSCSFYANVHISAAPTEALSVCVISQGEAGNSTSRDLVMETDGPMPGLRVGWGEWLAFINLKTIWILDGISLNVYYLNITHHCIDKFICAKFVSSLIWQLIIRYLILN